MDPIQIRIPKQLVWMLLHLVDQSIIRRTVAFSLKGMVHLLPQEERLVDFAGFYKQIAPTNGKW